MERRDLADNRLTLASLCSELDIAGRVIDAKEGHAWGLMYDQTGSHSEMRGYPGTSLGPVPITVLSVPFADHIREHGVWRAVKKAATVTTCDGGVDRITLNIDRLTEGTEFTWEAEAHVPIDECTSELDPRAEWYVARDGKPDDEATLLAWDGPGAFVMDEHRDYRIDNVTVLPEPGSDDATAMGASTFTAIYDPEKGRHVTLADLCEGLAALEATVTFAGRKIEEIREWQAAKEAEERAKDLPRQDALKPRRQYDPDSKLARKMDQPALYGAAGATLDVASRAERRRGREVATVVSFGTDEGIELSRPIGAYDREVHRAVSSLWVAGNRYITPQQVAKAMGIRNPTANQIRKVRESIDLQCSIRGEIDFTEEARGRSLEFEGQGQTAYIRGHIINADEMGIRAVNGREVMGYYMYRAPLIFQHAAMLGQVIDYPQRWLELGDGSDTDRNILLRSQLLRQVQRIKHKRHKGSNNIRFVTDPKHPDRECLFSRAGINQGDRHAKKAATEFVISILDGLKAEGAIAGYTLNQEAIRGGKSVYGVTIKP